ncbi:C3HC4 finger protein [Paecilomyces variotii No. 5]|uniref:C3HC4 finger protein n=1 Tax=Byssochlamys spectabilis (strain No. 5 / NBRC 109023) TaxID=1356009 RepID=V5G619_BYSSN|nr:C3HC4 finger protein [Paecilomyces variotii No. 5]
MPSANMETVQPAGLNNASSQTSTEQNAYNTEIWNQPRPTAQETSINTAHPEMSNNPQENQNGNAPRVVAPFWTGVNGHVPALASHQSTTSTPTNAGTDSGNNENPRGTSVHDWQPNVSNSWAEYDRIEIQRRALAAAQQARAAQVVGVPAFYTSNPHAYQQGLQQLGSHFVPQDYPLVPPASFSYSSPTETQHTSNYRLPPLPYPRANPPVALPRPQVSSTGAQQRGHEAQSSDSHTTTGPGANPSNNLNARRRARHPDDPGSHHPRRPSPPRYEGNATQPTNAQFADMPVPIVSATGHYMSYPAFNAHQHAMLTRQIQLNNVLRAAMRPEEAEALRMYGEGMSRSRRFHQTHTAPEEPPSMGLDNQNDGRPEPKEAEEMNVSLECKSRPHKAQEARGMSNVPEACETEVPNLSILEDYRSLTAIYRLRSGSLDSIRGPFSDLFFFYAFAFALGLHSMALLVIVFYGLFTIHHQIRCINVLSLRLHMVSFVRRTTSDNSTSAPSQFLP